MSLATGHYLGGSRLRRWTWETIGPVELDDVGCTLRCAVGRECRDLELMDECD